MNSIETLKQEIKKQKEAIEAIGGTVNVANLNPSPSEITMGIKTIPVPNLTNITVTSADVSEGKTFYASDGTIQTGTNIYSEDFIRTLFFYDSVSSISYTIPEGVKVLREYLFRASPSNLNLTLNSDLEEIDNYALTSDKKITVYNFSELANIVRVGNNAMAGCNNINFGQLPTSLTYVGGYGFSNAARGGDLVIPPNITYLGSHSIETSVPPRVEMNNFDITQTTLTDIMSNTFVNMNFLNDLVFPACIKTLGNYSFYNCAFPHITIPNTITNLKTNALGGNATHDVADFTRNLWTTFEAVAPPTIGANLFAPQFLETSYKIYVPDESVEAYKAVNNLKQYASIILPVSQRP